MNRGILVSIACANVLDFRADVLVLKHAAGLYGADAATYERLARAGAAIELPTTHEWVAVDTAGAIGADHVLFLGVGPLYEFEYPQIRDFGRTAIVAVGRALPTTEHIALTVHGPGYGLDEMEAFDSEIAGLVDGVRMGRLPPKLERVTLVELERRRADRLAARLQVLLPGGRIELESAAAVRRSSPEESAALRNAGYSATRKKRVFVAMPFRPEMDDTYDFGIFRPANECGYFMQTTFRRQIQSIARGMFRLAVPQGEERAATSKPRRHRSDTSGT